MCTNELPGSHDLVSIIIPIYNAEEYLTECIESVVNQTYKNLEILLIDDGSTDNSLCICESYQKKDDRIRVISKKNEGLGPTRNMGIDISVGKWIAFLDADDWFALNYVEYMISEALQNEADLVTCNICRYNMQTGEMSKMNCATALGIRYSRKEKLEEDRTGVVTKFALRELWIQNGIKMPNLYGEDFAVTMWILAVAKKIAMLDEQLYYYRKGRPGSISSIQGKKRAEIIDSARWLLDGMKKSNLFIENRDSILRNVCRNFSLVLTSGWTKMTQEEYSLLLSKCNNFLMTEFEDYHGVRIGQIGSYNLIQILRFLPYIQNTNNSFLFSSVISLMHPCKNTWKLFHNNKFREEMIWRDIISELSTGSQIDNLDVLVMDFIEERHDILCMEGGYITFSDALQTSDNNLSTEDIIRFGSDEWVALWKESFDNFFKMIIRKNIKLVIVENYLSEEYGTINEKNNYEDLNQIQFINYTLREIYQFVFEKYTSINKVSEVSNKLYFTDTEYEYGAFPWHLNARINRIIADDLYNIICE